MAKKKEEHIEFPLEYTVVAADLSLKRPGFCVLKVDKKDGETKLKIKELFSVDNKNDKKKSHGELLNEILMAFTDNVFPVKPNTFFVQEQSIMRQMTPYERSLSKVVGLLDFFVYKLANKEWYTIYPVTIKKLVAGSGKAEKDEVAAALEKYVGKQEYKCDDESDATAVAIAWLIQQGEL